MKIAFIGLGNMGGPMAHNLHKAGHEVRAFDLSQPARDKLAADGVPIAADAKAAVQGAEVVITMLPASQHVEGLFLGAGDLLAHRAGQCRAARAGVVGAAQAAGEFGHRFDQAQGDAPAVFLRFVHRKIHAKSRAAGTAAQAGVCARHQAASCQCCTSASSSGGRPNWARVSWQP